MFLTHPGNVVQAVDAASGDLIWEYAYDYPAESRTLGGPTKNIALYGDKVFLATYDAALVVRSTRAAANSCGAPRRMLGVLSQEELPGLREPG